MEGPVAAAAWDVSLHNFSARLWEQLVHFHVMRLTDSLFLWVGATPHLRNLAVAMCSRYDSIPVSTSLLGDTSDTTSTGLAQRLGLGGETGLACECGVERGLSRDNEAEGSAAPTPQHTSCTYPGGPARKTNKQVFVSYNLQNTDSNFALLVENRIKEEMEAFPEKF
ncbi:LOW QUALITY PROTEIN: proteasome assembly chaperone 4 [Sapajus apella]|uniref:LOW QUALITY PROTEIN: proteasome assembly chaperone 4 n=1 Tax=Sapajus apella TaxID=9515 RepID=A0A6J3FJL2_SAPAP|nr:LOW QUALITY PROTEIN: proteasome assembly chaperone 4 [Sapajus apella]